MWLSTHPCGLAQKGEPELQPGWFSPWEREGEVSAVFRRETGFAHLQDQSIQVLVLGVLFS